MLGSAGRESFGSAGSAGFPRPYISSSFLTVGGGQVYTPPYGADAPPWKSRWSGPERDSCELLLRRSDRDQPVLVPTHWIKSIRWTPDLWEHF